MEGASGVLEDMLGKSPDTGISLHGGPFPSDDTWYVGGAHIPGLQYMNEGGL